MKKVHFIFSLLEILAFVPACVVGQKAMLSLLGFISSLPQLA
jgi:hypothetical protein